MDLEALRALCEQATVTATNQHMSRTAATAVVALLDEVSRLRGEVERMRAVYEAAIRLFNRRWLPDCDETRALEVAATAISTARKGSDE
jgi:hypothetical protein